MIWTTLSEEYQKFISNEYERKHIWKVLKLYSVVIEVWFVHLGGMF